LGPQVRVVLDRWAAAMIKTILVPTSGGSSDRAVFDTALAAARLFSAHIDFCHVRIEAGEAIRYVPHAGFASGAALREALDTLGAEGRARSVAAVRHIEEFCRREKVMRADAPPDVDEVSASWSQLDGPAHDHVLTRARHSDLVVIGRDRGASGLPPDLLRLLLLESGRPILVAPPRARPRLTGTVMLCWKEAREPARAITAAMPFLSRADRVVAVTVDGGGWERTDGLADLVHQLGWHRIRAEPRVVGSGGRPVAEVLAAAARGLDADLLVMGGYGHRPLREDLFGGCTRSFMEGAEVPVLALH
jgi:nucleotide-binding universal stress UspA family protein